MNKQKNIELKKMATNGDFDKVKDILDNTTIIVNINYKDEYGWSPLMEASQKGHLNIVQLLINRGAKIDDKDNAGMTSLILASQRGQLDVVQFLLQNGADVNFISNIKKTALMSASWDNHLDVVQLLIESGANVDGKDMYGNTALHYACKNGTVNHLDVVQLLIESGANVDSKDVNGNTALHYACKNGTNIPIIKKLLESGSDPNITNNIREKPIDVFQGTEKDKEEVNRLIKKSMILHAVKSIDSSIGKYNNAFSENNPSGFENLENLKEYLGGKYRKTKTKKTKTKKTKRRRSKRQKL